MSIWIRRGGCQTRVLVSRRSNLLAPLTLLRYDLPERSCKLRRYVDLSEEESGDVTDKDDYSEEVTSLKEVASATSRKKKIPKKEQRSAEDEELKQMKKEMKKEVRKANNPRRPSDCVVNTPPRRCLGQFEKPAMEEAGEKMKDEIRESRDVSEKEDSSSFDESKAEGEGEEEIFEQVLETPSTSFSGKGDYLFGNCYSDQYENYGGYVYFDYYSKISEEPFQRRK